MIFAKKLLINEILLANCHIICNMYADFLPQTTRISKILKMK